MLIKEYRICMPLTVEEYRIAQLYMIQKKSRQESTDSESGVEILKNVPYTEGPGGNGQYTFKVYHIGSHLPGWLRSIIPQNALRVEEEAWNAYPYTKTRYRVPFVDKFTLELETKYLDDDGNQDDVFDLNPADKKARLVDFIDIVTDPISVSSPEDDPKTYISEVTGRGPLTKDWRSEFQAALKTGETYQQMGKVPDKTGSMTKEPLPKRIMCSYKLCRVEFRYWGLQSKIERFIHDIAIRKTMVNAHRQAWTWQDEWYGLTMLEIRELEATTALELAAKMRSLSVNEFNSEQGDSIDKLHPITSEATLNFGSCMSFNSESERASTMFRSLTNSDFEDDDDSEDFLDATSLTLNGITENQEKCIFEVGSDLCSSATAPGGLENLTSTRPQLGALLFLVHGGCLQDRFTDLSGKQADLFTFNSTLEHVIKAKYPQLESRVIVKMIPCPSVTAEAVQTLSNLDPSPLNSQSVFNTHIVRSFVPLGSIPLLFTNSPNYLLELTKLSDQLNEVYKQFCESAVDKSFNGVVSVVADSIGSILMYDLLLKNEHQPDDSPSNRKIDKFPSSEKSPLVPITQSCNLNFVVQDLFLLGSSLGLLIALRKNLSPLSKLSVTDDINQTMCNKVAGRPFCKQVFNLFHLADPFAYRLEPMLVPKYSGIPVVNLQPYSEAINHSIETITANDSDLPQSVLTTEISNQTEDCKNTDLKLNQSEWWGSLRIDYGLHCSERVQQILTRALPSLVHSSYWESKEICDFISNQIVNQLDCRCFFPELATNPENGILNSLSTVGSFNSDIDDSRGQNPSSSMSAPDPGYLGMSRNLRNTITSRLRFKSRPAERPKMYCLPYPIVVNPNHRANDVIVLESQPQIINARFVYGTLDLYSLANEKVNVKYQPLTSGKSGLWFNLGSDLTDSNGRISFTIQENLHLPIGLYRLQLIAVSDEEHPIEITFAVVSKNTDVVICSIDGSFAASISLMGKDPKVRPGSVDVMRYWQRLGYLLIYLSARPDMQYKQVSNWLALHNFPMGLRFFLDGICTDPMRQKTQLLTAIVQQAQLNVYCAYGSGKDVQIYKSLGIQPDKIFVVGKLSRRHLDEATRISEGYAVHLQNLVQKNVLSKPAVGQISSVIHRIALDLPATDVYNTKRPIFFHLADEVTPCDF